MFLRFNEAWYFEFANVVQFEMMKEIFGIDCIFLIESSNCVLNSVLNSNEINRNVTKTC